MVQPTSRLYASIIVTDFLVWSSSTGLYPLLSRMAEAEVGPEAAPEVIANMVLLFTLGAVVGRWMAGRFEFQPRTFVTIATSLCLAALLALFGPGPAWWYLARSVQGLALGCYAISVMMLMSETLPAHRRMRGFALIGMADFLGFAFGPVVSGLLVSSFGFGAALSVFVAFMILALLTGRSLPHLPRNQDPEPQQPDDAKWPLRFLPLSLALFVGFMLHLYYGAFLPITVETVRFPVETLFFAGYIAGGLGFRLGFVALLERYEGPWAFAATLLLMGATSLFVASWPETHAWLDGMVLVTGMVYGLGFEALYIFSLAWVSRHASPKSRAHAFTLVFWGIDVAAIVSGLSYGHLAHALGAKGLLHLLLYLNGLFVVLPWALGRLFAARRQDSGV